MNIDDILDSSSSNTDEFIVTDEMRDFLKEAAKWAKFMAIVAFVMMGLGVLGLLFSISDLIAMLSIAMGSFASVFVIIYIAFFILFIFPPVYLYKFAVNTQKALVSNDQLFLRDAFKNLKSLFKFMGIFTAVFVGFYLIVIAGLMLFGLGANF